MAGIDDFENRVPARPNGIHGIEGLRTMRRSSVLEQAWRYWTSKRMGADLPRRAALDPKAMGPILGHSMVLDRVQPGTVRIRLGGHVLHDLMGMDVRGLPVRAFFDVADRARMRDAMEQVFETPATLELDLISDGDHGLVTGRMLILPLRDAAGNVTKALATLVSDRMPTDAPRRFQLTHATILPVAGVPARPTPEPRRRLSDYHLPVEIQARDMQPGLAEEALAFDAKPSSVPWLRVVK